VLALLRGSSSGMAFESTLAPVGARSIIAALSRRRRCKGTPWRARTFGSSLSPTAFCPGEAFSPQRSLAVSPRRFPNGAKNVSGKRGTSLAPQCEAVGAGNSVQPCLTSSVGLSFSSLIAVGPGRGPTPGWTGPCPDSAQ
jgi:hypothetical protein